MKIVIIAIVIIIIVAIVVVGIYTDWFGLGQSNKNDKPCELNCLENEKEIKKYYDEESVWKGKYTMTPIKSNRINETDCDVLYKYNAISENIGENKNGEDYRRFRMESDNNCNWKVKTMFGLKSGLSLQS